MNVERQAPYSLPPLGQAYSSGSSSPRLGPIAPAHGSYTASQSSYTSAASSVGPKTPPPVHGQSVTELATNIVSYDAMNHNDMYYAQHMSAGQSAAGSSSLGHYQQHQPPMLPSAHPHYQPSPYPYGYSNGLTSPGPAPPVPNGMPSNVLPHPGSQGPMSQGYAAGFDTTGQAAPVGAKPRVTATLWEDEGSLCFQVEARGICVARREDNHMINGTKLLNVAGMTRGRRDGILKSEKVRHVVKIGPMHLKGVWIPYERALEFANKEKITELLYPLFVNNIGAMLYHPTNQTRTNQAMPASALDRNNRKPEQSQPVRNHSSTGLPSMQQPPHHAMATLPSHSPIGRPGLERAHTFPTPPASASGVMGSGMPSSDSFNWQGQSMSGQQATTPPSGSLQSMPAYPSAAPGYDSQRQMYGASSQPSSYPSNSNGVQDRAYSQHAQYNKADMAPPAGRPSIQEQEPKSEGHGAHGDEEGEQEHETEYTHDSASYDRATYNYNSATVGPMPSEASMPSELTGSPNHPNGSGRATPRTTAPTQPYYQNPGYSTPPRVQQASNLYNVMSSDRGSNGVPHNDGYANGHDGSLHNGYASQPPPVNGSGSGKRGRDDEDAGSDGDMKRRRMIETPVPAPVYDSMNRSASAVGPHRH